LSAVLRDGPACLLRAISAVDAEATDEDTLAWLAPLVSDPNLSTAVLSQCSRAGAALCRWLRAADGVGRGLGEMSCTWDDVCAARHDLDVSDAAYADLEADIHHEQRRSIVVERRLERISQTREGLERRHDDEQREVGQYGRLLSFAEQMHIPALTSQVAGGGGGGGGGGGRGGASRMSLLASWYMRTAALAVEVDHAPATILLWVGREMGAEFVHASELSGLLTKWVDDAQRIGLATPSPAALPPAAVTPRTDGVSGGGVRGGAATCRHVSSGSAAARADGALAPKMVSRSPREEEEGRALELFNEASATSSESMREDKLREIARLPTLSMRSVPSAVRSS